MGSNGSSADVALVNGAVYTVDAVRSWAQAVAIKDGRIAAVGTDDSIRDAIGSRTEVVDLAGRMVVPGFQDAHVHPVGGGLDMLQCDLHDLSTAEEHLEAIKIYADTHPEVEWILGGGWSMDAFPGGTPTAEVLDEIVPDRPVYLPNRDGHGIWVNSLALKIGGITRDTPDPDDGRIERNVQGEPSGTLHEGAMDLVAEHAPEVTAEALAEALRRGQAYLQSLGITGWQDAIVTSEGRESNYDTYVAAAANGDLTGRVVGALWWDRHRGLEQIEELIERREQGRAGRFSPTSVKIMQDGVCENFTAGVLEPYLGQDGLPAAGRGLSFVEPELLKEAVTALDAAGFQVHFHALAERAVREALDAIEAALVANGPSNNRHHLAHIQIVHPDDIPRFRRIGAVANAQPLWAAHESQMDDLTIPFLGEPRWRWQYPFASLVRAGATLAMGSDWSVSTADPLQEIHVAVNRAMPADYPHKVENREPFLPDERLDLPTALAAFTMGSAFVNHLDRETGSIERGKFADLAVIDRDLFELPVGQIADATVHQTYVGGERVYAAPDA